MACSGILGIDDPDIVAHLGPSDEGGTTREGGAESGGPGSEAGLPDSGLQCPPNFADCNKIASDGCEVVTTTPSNCGSCGHVCLACDQGKCVPQTVATGGGTDYAGFLSVDAANLYWASAGGKGVFVVAKSGGTPARKLTADPFDATSIYVGAKYAGATVYSSAEGVRMLDPGTGAAVTGIQNDGCNAALGIIADEVGDIYYAHGSDSGACGVAPMHITKRSPNGGGGFSQPWDFALGSYRAGESEWMALDAQYLYFVGFRETVPGLYRISRAGGNSFIVAAGQFNGAALAVDATSIYTVVNNDEVAGALVAYDKVTGVKTVLATGEKSFMLSATQTKCSLAIDATHVYWTSGDGAASGELLGRVMRIPKAGGMKEVLADKQPGAYGVAIDGAFVYWTTSTAIKRIPK